jgi:hypothetical protein
MLHHRALVISVAALVMGSRELALSCRRRLIHFTEELEWHRGRLISAASGKTEVTARLLRAMEGFLGHSGTLISCAGPADRSTRGPISPRSAVLRETARVREVVPSMLGVTKGAISPRDALAQETEVSISSADRVLGLMTRPPREIEESISSAAPSIYPGDLFRPLRSRVLSCIIRCAKA